MLLYTTEYADTRLVWIGADGQFLGERFFPLRNSRALAAGSDGAMLVCGSARNRRLHCAGFAPGAGAGATDVGDLYMIGAR